MSLLKIDKNFLLLWPPNMTFYWNSWFQLATHSINSLFSFFVILGLIWTFWTLTAQTYHNNKSYLFWPYFTFQSCIWQLMMKNYLLISQWGPLLNQYIYRKFDILYFYAISLFSLSVHVHQNQDHPLELHMVHAFQVLNVLPTVEQQMEIVLQALVFVVFISEYWYNWIDK